MLDSKGKRKLEDFLRDFWGAWYSIEEPAKLLSKYFKIDDEKWVHLKLYWKNYIYIGKISDISLDDVRNVANTIRVLAENALKHDEEERFQWT